MTDARAEAGEVDERVLEDEPTTEAEQDQNQPTGDPLKDTQRALHEKTQELASMKEQMAELKGAVDVLKAGPAPTTEQQSDPFAEAFDDSWWEDAFDSPAKLKGLTQKQIRVIGATIEADRKAFKSEIEALRNQLKEYGQRAANPVDPALQSRIAKLKEDPDFAKLPQEVLAKMAKAMPTYGGGPPAGGRVQPRGHADPSLKGVSAEALAKADEVLKRHGMKGLK